MGRSPLVVKPLFPPVNDQIYETVVFQVIVDYCSKPGDTESLRYPYNMDGIIGVYLIP
jgi:hypothetical protein